MTARQIRPDERDAAHRVQTIAFLGASDPDYDTHDPEDEKAHCWAYFNEDDTLMACLDVLPYTMMFDGHLVKMAGIGSVSTLPEHRRGGHVRSIFQQIMTPLRDEGVLFSYLYPFSHDFYRRFGYELCSVHDVATIQLEHVNRFASTGHLEHFQKDDPVTPYLEVHQAFSRAFNLAVVQDEAAMRYTLESASDNKRRYVYLWRDDAGQAKSYLVFSTEGDDSPCTMVIRRFEWLDGAGFQGMLSMLSKFSNPYEKCRWHVPPGVDYTALVSEPWKIECSRECCGMGRVIDVPAALALMRPPISDGGVVISVVDDFLAWNNSNYAVEWSSGALNVTPTKQSADATIPVTTLMQLMCGFTTPATAQLSNSLTIDSGDAALAQLFPPKPIYITERF